MFQLSVQCYTTLEIFSYLSFFVKLKIKFEMYAIVYYNNFESDYN